jgi:phosphatidyl-myo-inositol dimannoside synthase
MKAVLVCPELFASEGGIPRILRLYALAMAEDPTHTEVAVIVLNDPPPPPASGRFAPSDRIRYVLAARSRVRFARAVLGETRTAGRWVVGHLHLLPLVRLASLVRRGGGGLYVVAHGVEVDRPLSVAQRWALAGVRRVWCVSADTRRRLLQHAPRLDPSRCHVLANAIAPELAPKTVAAPVGGTPTILCVSRLDARERYKGVEDLLRALVPVRTSVPEARLRVVGEGDDRPRLERLAGELGLGAATVFCGALSDAALSAEFAGCRVFALPSTREGFGLVFAEAMAHGRPIVGVSAGAVPELVRPDTGLLAPPGDIGALAVALADALRRSWDWTRIAAAASVYTYPAFRSRLAKAY